QGRLVTTGRPSPTGTGLAETHYETNLAGMVTTVSTTDGWSATGNLGGQLVIQDMDYDLLGNLVHQTVGSDTETVTEQSWTYNNLGQLIDQSDALGNMTRYGYDAWDRLEFVELPELAGINASDTIDYAYNDAGHLTSITDPTGLQTVYKVNLHGDVVAAKTPNPDSSDPYQPWATTSFEYDKLGRVLRTIDPLGLQTDNEYHRTGSLSSVRQRDLTSSTVLESISHVDPLGRPYVVFHPDGSVTGYQYEGPYDQPTAITRLGADGQNRRETTHYYDSNGRLQSTLDATQAATNYEYDSDDNLKRVVRDFSQFDRLDTESWTYDNLGRMVEHLSSEGILKRNEYDPAGRLLSTTTADDTTVAYGYDASGRMSLLTDADGNPTSWIYDSRGRVTSESNASGFAQTFVYDAAGRIQQSTDRNGDSSIRDYNSAGLLQSETWWNADGTVADFLEFQYDSSGRMTQASDNDSVVDRTFNAFGSLLSESTTLVGFTGTSVIEKAYDSLNRFSERELSIGAATAFVDSLAYDSLSQLTSISRANQGSAGTGLNVEFGYDSLGRLATIDRGVTSNGTSYLMPSTQFAYYATGRIASVTHTATSSLASSLPSGAIAGTDPSTGLATINRHTNEYYDLEDHIGSFAHVRSSQRGTDGGTTTFNYGDDGQLREINTLNNGWSSQFIHTANGNRIGSLEEGETRTYDTGVDNRLLSDSVYDYQNDAEGRRIYRAEQAEDGSSGMAGGFYDNYSFDQAGHLTSITSGHAATGDFQEVSYSYDALGRRIAKEVEIYDTVALSRYSHGGQIDEDSSEGFAVGGYAERYVNDGDHVLAVLDRQGNVQEQLLHGVMVDQVLAEEKFDSASGQREEVLITLGNDQHTISDVLRWDDTSESVTAHAFIDYSAFGVERSNTDESIQPRFGYTGRERDTESDLQYNRARYLDPQTGRWISNDPIGFEAGDSNLHRYVGNSPTTATDPSGLVLVVIDGTGSKDWSVHPDGTDPNTGRRKSHSHNFYVDYVLAPGESKFFFHGPCNEATGSDSDDIFRGALKKLAGVLNKNPQQEVNIVGHSRGGYIAMELARHLQSNGYRVNFLGLYDAVDMAPGFGEAETIPSNVDYAAHALSNPSLRNRPYFNTADHGAEDLSKMTRCDIRMFRATHGGVGGAPYAGGYRGRTTPALEKNVSAEVDRWMRDRAQGAGVNIPDTP
ncbi:RHS repeat-associated core domain-containing protein, partial [Rhodopirellula bahusiensis]